MFSKRETDSLSGRDQLPPKPKFSIANQLTSHYIVSAVVILSILMLLVYWGIYTSLRAKSIQFMNDEERVIQTIVAANSIDGLMRKIRLSEERGFAKLHIRVLDQRRNVIVESTSMRHELPVILFAEPKPIESPKLHEYIRVKVGNKTYLTESLWLHVLGEPKIIQMGLDLTTIESVLPGYLEKLFLLLLLGILLSGLAGRHITRKGLRPLRQIAEKGKQINASNLEERFRPQNWPVEMYDLTVSLDGMLDRLQDSFDKLKSYSANLAHELRNPINNLMIEAESALSNGGDVKYYQDVIASNMEEYQRISKIIDGLLFLAWAASSEATLKMELVKVNEEIRNLHDYYDNYSQGHAFIILCDDDTTIWADPTLFRRALSNIIKNAISYSPNGGTIMIEAGRAGDLVEVSVTDQGIGITPEDLERVYDRFFRVSSGETVPRGTGLGLSIVRSIMQLHGGSVRMLSEIGKGTTVVLAFPHKPA